MLDAISHFQTQLIVYLPKAQPLSSCRIFICLCQHNKILSSGISLWQDGIYVSQCAGCVLEMCKLSPRVVIESEWIHGFTGHSDTVLFQFTYYIPWNAYG